MVCVVHSFTSSSSLLLQLWIKARSQQSEEQEAVTGCVYSRNIGISISKNGCVIADIWRNDIACITNENKSCKLNCKTILIYRSSLNLPPLNPGVTNFQGHFFQNITDPSSSLYHLFPLPSTWYVCLVSAQNGHTVCTSCLTHQKILLLY